MSSEEFRENGYAVVDRIVKYLEEVEKHAVLPSVKPCEIASSMPDRFAYFPANPSPPSILAEFVIAGLGDPFGHR